ncbi:MAG: hypothetical protein QNJ46_27045 [Leptolyngbyaceae cyanobacterium MO_188.B28]|nr:hypothetical protein [Leptolyngbyaceae cyanobacterium MO_188.B28]
MKVRQNYSWMIQLIGKLTKYFLFGCFGIAITIVLSSILGLGAITQWLLDFLNDYFWRSLATLLCLLAIAVFLESMGHWSE